MNSFDKDYSVGLLDNCDPPCISLYLPTHRNHPDNQQDPIRYKNLLKTLEESLLQKFSTNEVKDFLEPFMELAEDRDFWNHTLDSLAVLGATGVFRVYKLQRPVTELAVVADSFHTKPLMRILQSADRYQVLCLNRHEIKLYEGNRDVLDEIRPAEGVPRTITEALGDELTEPHLTVASYGGVGSGHSPMNHGHGGKESEVDQDEERFFRAVDRAVMEHHSKPSGLPLILASLPMHHHLFHEVSHNPYLINDSIDIHPDGLPSISEFRLRAWQLVEPRYLKRLAALVEEYGNAKSQELGEEDLTEIAKAAVAGRVATVLIEANREIPGRVNMETGDIQWDDLINPEIDDVLDDLATLAVKMGGQALIVPAEGMPTTTGIAAIYRY